MSVTDCRCCAEQILLDCQFRARFVTSPAEAVAKYCDEHVHLWVCLSVCLLSVCPWGYLRNHTCDLYQIFVPVACVRGSVLWYVYNRSHRVSPGRGFLPPWKCIIGQERGMGVHSAGEVCYLQLPCYLCQWTVLLNERDDANHRQRSSAALL